MKSEKEAQEWLDSIVGVYSEYHEDDEFRRWVINTDGEVGYILPQDMEITYRSNDDGSSVFAGFQLSRYGRKNAPDKDKDIFIRWDHVFRTSTEAVEYMDQGSRKK